MYQFRQIADDRLLLGRPRCIEWFGMAALVAGLALVGAPLTGEFENWEPLLAAGIVLIAIGVRLCYLYERITITRLERDILLEGSWSRSAFRVKKDEIRAACSYRRGWGLLGNASHSQLLLITKPRDAVVVYWSPLQETTDHDAWTLAKFLGVPCKIDGDLDRLNTDIGRMCRALWPRKRGERGRES